MWSFLGKLLGGSKTSSPAPVATQLPPLPVGSIAAVADALTQAGRIAEQQVSLHNTAAMQQSALTVQDQAVKDKIERDITNKDIDSTRTDLAN